jgi:single-strand DNA-binding protein
VSNINRVVLTGNLCADPDLRSLPSGSTVCELRLAVNTRQKVNGEWGDKTHFFNVVLFGQQAENAAKYLAKGRPVAVDGRLDYQEWERDGQKRNAVKIVGDNLQYLNAKGDGDGGSNGHRPPADLGDFAPAAAQTRMQPTDDEDIPF